MPRLDPQFDPVAAANAGPDYYGPRWSYHYGRPPDFRWLENPTTEEWFLSIANNSSIDPGATLAAMETAYRQEAARLGIRLDLTSANTILAMARLNTGQTSWKAIAGEGGSVQPSGPGALPTNYLDTYAARQQAAIDAVVAQIDPNNYNGDDAAILAGLEGTGVSFDSGLSRIINVTPIPMPSDARIAGASASGGGTLVYPQSGAAPAIQNQTSPMPALFAAGAGGGFDMRWLVYGALAFIAYKALKGSK